MAKYNTLLPFFTGEKSISSSEESSIFFFFALGFAAGLRGLGAFSSSDPEIAFRLAVDFLAGARKQK